MKLKTVALSLLLSCSANSTELNAKFFNWEIRDFEPFTATTIGVKGELSALSLATVQDEIIDENKTKGERVVIFKFIFEPSSACNMDDYTEKTGKYKTKIEKYKVNGKMIEMYSDCFESVLILQPKSYGENYFLIDQFKKSNTVELELSKPIYGEHRVMTYTTEGFTKAFDETKPM